MKCQRQCRVEPQVMHARNAETRLLACIGELAQEIVSIKMRLLSVEYALTTLTGKKFLRKSKLKN